MRRPCSVPKSAVHGNCRAERSIGPSQRWTHRALPIGSRLKGWQATCSAALLGLFCSACDSGASRRQGDADPAEVTTPAPGDAEIRFDQTFQRISGFGASSAWTAPALDDDLADLFFSEDSGLGFSLLRVRITPDGETDELETAMKAKARGADVWASPWSPPGAWKSNGSDIHGGTLLPEHYGDWAQRLADFAQSMADQGIPLSMLSPQNEPNWVAEWETCEWLPTELTSFVRDYLGPALAAAEVETKVIAPEANNWSTIEEYADSLLDDAAASSFLGAVATHSYGGSPFAYTAPADNGLEFWQTEYTDEGTVDREMGSGLNVALAIHDHLTVAGVSAWHYWWLLPSGPESNSALFVDGEMTRRGYVLGNWSKFVRPGFVRVAVTSRPQTGVLVSAFHDPGASRFAIIAINANISAMNQDFVFSSGGTAQRVVPWVTSATRALEAQSAVGVEAGAFSYKLEPVSVTTFVGDISAAEGEAPTSGNGGAGGASAAGAAGDGGSIAGSAGSAEAGAAGAAG